MVLIGDKAMLGKYNHAKIIFAATLVLIGAFWQSMLGSRQQIVSIKHRMRPRTIQDMFRPFAQLFHSHRGTNL
jgi:hypothetical protein